MKENHKLQFRCLIFPADLVMEVEEGRMTRDEAWLAMYIDGFVIAKGEGCWASNAYLAKRMLLSTRQVKRMIRHLKEIGIVKEIGKKRIGTRDFRILETVWSRVEKEIVYKRIDDTHDTHMGDTHVPQSNKDKIDITPCRSSGKSVAPLLPSHDSDVERNPPKKKKCVPSSENSLAPLAPSTDTGFFNSDNKSVSTSKKECAFAIKLHEALIKKNKLMRKQSSLKKWERSFSEFIRSVPAFEIIKIENVLDWYCKNIGGPMIPEAYSADSFIKKYPNIVSAMGRDKSAPIQSRIVIANVVTETVLPNGRTRHRIEKKEVLVTDHGNYIDGKLYLGAVEECR